jgi:hypothetical protein
MDEGYDAVNLERVRQLIRGEPLEALPADAFAPRTGRMRRNAARPQNADELTESGPAE